MWSSRLSPTRPHPSGGLKLLGPQGRPGSSPNSGIGVATAIRGAVPPGPKRAMGAVASIRRPLLRGGQRRGPTARERDQFERWKEPPSSTFIVMTSIGTLFDSWGRNPGSRAGLPRPVRPGLQQRDAGAPRPASGHDSAGDDRADIATLAASSNEVSRSGTSRRRRSSRDTVAVRRPSMSGRATPAFTGVTRCSQ